MVFRLDYSISHAKSDVGRGEQLLSRTIMAIMSPPATPSMRVPIQLAGSWMADVNMYNDI